MPELARCSATQDGRMVYQRSLEMSLSREEFFRLLPAAVGAFEVEGDVVRWRDGDRSSTIRLVHLPNHRFGGVFVPRHRIEIVLDVRSEAEAEAFMDRVHRAFLRSGG